MKLESDSETLAENKVLILYVLNNINKPITSDALYNLITSSIELNYFYFQQFLLDLIDVKYIVRYKKDNQDVYEITEAGKNTLDLTLDILPGIKKLKIDTNFKNNMDIIENQESIVAEYTPKSEQEYEIDCKIIENSETIFEIKTLAYSREQAQKIVDNWKRNASKIYPEIINIITNSKQED